MGFLDQLLAVFWPRQLPSPEQPKKASTPPAPVPEPHGPVVPMRKPPPDLGALREWRLTDYYLANQDDHPNGAKNTPILDRYGQVIDYATPGFFASLSLEGSGICSTGNLLNVASVWVKCDPSDYADVLAYHKKYLSKRSPTYSGLLVQNDQVVKVLAFLEIPHDKFGKGFGVCNGIPLDPYRTLAADIGKGKRSDPLFKAQGGVVPVGTEVYIKELDGFLLPDGSTHDGWCVVNDTGGAIFGAHFDVFTGHHMRGTKFQVPALGHIWFVGIEKIPTPYTYGLKDE